MSRSRPSRKKRLIEHMASLGYVLLQFNDREFFKLSKAHRVPMRFKIDPLIEPALVEFAMKKWGLKKHELDWTQLTRVRFSSRKSLSKWLHTTGKVIEDEFWREVAKAEVI